MESAELTDRILALMGSELFGVLCTCIENDPYGSPMAYDFSPDLQFLDFATTRKTRKYRTIAMNPRAVCVVDNRHTGGNDPSTSEVLIASGQVTELTSASEIKDACQRLCFRHSNFEPFFRSPSTAFLRLWVSSYTFVSGLDEGVELIMG